MTTQAPTLRIRLNRDSRSSIVGGEISLSGDVINRKMTISVTEDLGGLEGNFSTRILYDISLIYMSIDDLATMLSSTGLFEVFLSTGATDAPANLMESADILDSSDDGSDDGSGSVGFKWYTFKLPEEYSDYSSPNISDSDKLSFFLTSIDPASELQTTQRSFGKYINSAPFAKSARLLSKTSLYSSSIEVDDGDIFSGVDYVQINSEVMTVESISDGSIFLDSRSTHGTANQFHLNKDPVIALDVLRVFSSSFGESSSGEFEQYRCIAIANNSRMVLGDVEAKAGPWNKINKSRFSIFFETPMVESFETTVVVGGFSDFSVEEVNESHLNKSIINPENINPFLDQLVTFVGGENNGQQRIIVGYDIDTGLFSLNNDLPYQLSLGDSVTFEVSPSSSSHTGTIDPRAVGNGIYSDEIELKEGQTLSIGGMGRAHGNNMLPGDVMYLWIKRSLAESSVESDEIPFLDFLYSVV
ncbi:hypothetical protein CL614_03030 [archaeon]|nr:hypothetical protein [archaeon]|tara:strand:- start:1493 stop:2908 length:1416 start_codon:yes stop_codon:yes gene_type:complete